MFLSVIVLAYNEEKRLIKTLKEIDKYLKKQAYSYEILIVNDGSSDGTAKIVENQILRFAEASLHLPERSEGREMIAEPSFVSRSRSAQVNEVQRTTPVGGRRDKSLLSLRSLCSLGARRGQSPLRTPRPTEPGSAIKDLKLISYKKNRGKGYAVRQGMLEAKGDYRLFTDADNSAPISQIEKILPEFQKGYDVVIGSRDLEGAVLDPHQSFFRRFLGETFGFLTNLILGTWGIADKQCGFKCFNKKAAEDIFPRSKIDGFAFDPEILVIAKRRGYKIKEVPIYWRNNPNSKVNFKSIIEMAISLLKIRFNLWKGVYDQKIRRKSKIAKNG